MYEVLIIDDDIQIGNMEEEVLTKAGYKVIRAYSGTEAVLLLKNVRPDLILLDLMLPGLSGEEILPIMKGIPVIVVSAKVDVDEKVKLLMDGAVDYITKPFYTKELLARIEVQLRKQNTVVTSTYHYGNISLNSENYSVTIKGDPVLLTKTEYAILKLLIQNPGQVMPKSTILDRISEDTPDCTESSLKTHISHLRSKLRERDGVDYIESVWGIGFKMAKL